MQAVPERSFLDQPIQSLSPIKFEITGKHIPNQPWNDHANYFAVLEDDDDVTVAASNISEGYYDEDNIGMLDVPPTTADTFSTYIGK